MQKYKSIGIYYVKFWHINVHVIRYPQIHVLYYIKMHDTDLIIKSKNTEIYQKISRKELFLLLQHRVVQMLSKCFG